MVSNEAAFELLLLRAPCFLIIYFHHLVGALTVTAFSDSTKFKVGRVRQYLPNFLPVKTEKKSCC